MRRIKFNLLGLFILPWGEGGMKNVELDFRKLGFCMRRRLLLSKASYKNVVIFFQKF